MSSAASEPRKRRYDSTRRQAAAAARRERVLDVATRRFAELGWSGTTLAGIAAEAEVSVELVSQAFGTKAQLLLTAFRRAGFGTEPDLRAALKALRLDEDCDRGRRLERISDFARDVLTPMARLGPALANAADQDDEARHLLASVNERRRETCSELVDVLADPDVLRGWDGARRQRAGDVLYALTSWESYHLFVGDLAWTPDAYGEWLRSALAMTLAE